MTLLFGFGVAAVLSALAGGAGAATIGFSPASQQASLGDSVSFDIVVSELEGEIVSSYDLDVSFDAAVLAVTGVLFTTALGDPDLFDVLLGFDTTTPGLADLSALSLLDDADLLALQGGDSVTLATLDFTVVGPGTSSLSFLFDPPNEITGANGALLVVTSASGTLVPEPSSALLLLLSVLLARSAARYR